MGDSTKHSNRVMNPWVLHLQKLALELKCPLCLKLLNRPLLLPCDHMFCDSCLPRSTQLGSECPMCKSQHANRDLRLVPFVENILTIYRSLDAAFCPNLLQLQSVEDGVGKNGVVDKCSAQKDGKDIKFEASLEGGIKYSGAQDLNLPTLGSQVSDGRGQESKFGNVQVEMNQEEQLLPESPPSFGDAKGYNDNSDQCSDHSPEDYLAQAERNFDGRTRQKMHGSSTSGTEEGHLRDYKRQKKLNYEPPEMDLSGACHIQSVELLPGSLGASNSDLERRSGAPIPGSQPPVMSDDSYASKTICGFCQSSAISEVTGKMLHFANGKQVVGDDAFRSNVIHVHSTCINWAPQVYYEGDTVKNLKAELARGAKLKCSRCGLKGAALGCYVKSCRRSYHAPCATEISKCRWDYEDYLLLCPTHSSVKFPKEKSGTCTSQNHTIPTQICPQQSSFPVAPPNGAKEWVFCGSALSSDEKFLLVKFASMVGATVSKLWKPNVTHVIAATDEKGACTRTLKVLMAILNGKWVLKMDWIKACMEAMHPVDEELYEVSLDNHGCRDGPKTGRIRALDNAPKLFNGMKFYFSSDFMPGYKEDLQNLVMMAGGTILSSKELVAQNVDDQVAPSRVLVVYNLDTPQGSLLVDEVSTIWQRLNEAEELATKIGSQVIGHTWLLESIAAYKLQPVVDRRLLA